MMDQEFWIKVNQNLVAKSIGELTFEQVLNPVLKDVWELTLASGVTYSFQGWRTVWEHLRVDSSSLKRNGEAVRSAAQFFIDSQNETGMDDIILGNFLEEMHNTLYSDICLHHTNREVKVHEMAQWDGELLQIVLEGHPKILLNKGRIGWGEKALEHYSPESGTNFQLHWLAVDNSLLLGKLPQTSILDESFSEEAKQALLSQIDTKKFSVIPVHPWQWDHYVSIQFAGLISEGKILYLGKGGDFYRPQISIRTLSNTTRPLKADIKLPLSILNTSCVRGLPAKSIATGPKVSEILSSICEEDELLKSSGTEVLKEMFGVALLHPEYAQVKEAPYRYHEYLGALWRESAQSKISEGEKAIITAALFHQDENKKSLIGEYIKLSGLSQEEWLKRYFRAVVIPLYHLQLEYGVGMVAHGQNIILKLKNFAPSGMILKDFQGDLRLSLEMPSKGKKLFEKIEGELTKLPPHYLIHDLITGHFITVLRFISGVMKESDEFEEKKFYGILSELLQEYAAGRTISDQQNLLAKTFPRVLLNKVRFAIGYSDSAARPLPMVGKDLMNPLSIKS